MSDEKKVLEPCPQCGHLPTLKRKGPLKRFSCCNIRCVLRPKTKWLYVLKLAKVDWNTRARR